MRHRGGRKISAVGTTYADTLVAPDTIDTELTSYPDHAQWEGVIGMEGELTGDGRMIAPEALRWDVTDANRPQLRFVRSDVGAHDGAETAGHILSIERRPGGVIYGTGDFDMSSEAGREAYRNALEGRQNGVSMDLDDVSFEIRVAAELLDEMDEMMAAMFGDEDFTPPEREVNEDGTVTVHAQHPDDEIMYTTSARVRALTQVAIPAFASASIRVRDPEDEEEDATPPGSDQLALVAGAAPVRPPSAWFDPPNLPGPTPLTITPEGHVYGHLAVWGTCHVSHSAGGKCVTPPNSPSGYSNFHTGAVETSDDYLVSTGHLTFDTGHADDGLTPAQTARHYDHTGTVAADVCAGEDAYGIWVSGAMRSTLSDEQLREVRAAPLSGDWREVNGHLELVAALAVNVPGFGVPRPHGKVRNDSLVSLVASGMIVPVAEDGPPLSKADLTWLRAFVAAGVKNELTALADRRNRVRVGAFARSRRKDR